MATSFEHRALVEQLRALTQKRAENPGESILNTSHPSGSNSAADDHTSPAVVGHRYAENTADNKAMYPLGTDSDTKLEAGSQQKDPGHNKGVKVRPSGEAPEVERKYNLNDNNDPGSSHPSGKNAADAFIAEARSLAAELRNIVKASQKADSYVTGNVDQEATDNSKKDAKGTAAYPVNADNDGNIPLTKEQGKDAAAKLAAIREMAIRDMLSMREDMKTAAARDAESFVQSVTAVMDKFAAPHVLPVIQAEKQAAAAAQIHGMAEKIAAYDILAEIDGTPKFAEVMAGAQADAKPAEKSEKKKPDADGDGVPDWADKKPGDDAEEKMSQLKKLKKAAAALEAEIKAEKEGSSRKGRTFRKLAEDEMMEEEEEGEEESPESEEEISSDEEAAAEQALMDMAAMPAGGGAPDEMAAMMDPAMMGAEGQEPPMTPEDEAALMALMQQEGMKESDVRSYAKASALIAAGKVDPTKLSAAQVSFLQTCDGAVKRAGAKFQTLRSASRLRNELNSIYKGIQS
jgi:hypothetical protein